MDDDWLASKMSMQTKADRHLVTLTPTSRHSLLYQHDDDGVSGGGKRLFMNSQVVEIGGHPSPNLCIQKTFNDQYQRKSNTTSTPQVITATRILDAPRLQDDYYLNLLDWSDTNMLAIGLHDEVYLWDAASAKVTALTHVARDDRVTAVSWSHNGILAIGTKNGRLEIIDVPHKRRLIAIKCHVNRIGSLSWSPNGVLATGSRDRAIHLLDPRSKSSTIAHLCNAHEQEVCGLHWDGTGLLASGGNDNNLHIWDSRKIGEVKPVYRMTEHLAAVKAIAWSPHQRGLFVSGGGTADRSLRFWNVFNNTPTQSISHTTLTSQVCNVKWSPHSNELVTAHGFSEHHCLRWSYPEMTVTGVMRGHTQRVLYMAMSPDGGTVATASPDETIRLWPVFGKSASSKRLSSLLLDSSLDYKR